MFNVMYDKNSNIVIAFGCCELVPESVDQEVVSLATIPMVLQLRENQDKQFIFNTETNEVEVME